jgi:hypothetical protein
MKKIAIAALLGAFILSFLAAQEDVKVIGSISLQQTLFSLASRKSLVYMPDGWQKVKEFRTKYADDLECVLYYPGEYDMSLKKGIVIIGNGLYEDEEDDIKQNDGASYKDLSIIKTWAIALAARGIPAVTYDSKENRPGRGQNDAAAVSTDKVIAFLDVNNSKLAIDSNRIGILAMGDAAQNIQLSLATQEWAKRVQCVVYNYPLLDPELTQGIKVKTMVVRTGASSSGLLFAIDDYVENEKKRGNDINVLKNVTGGHNYDTGIDNEETRTTIKLILDYIDTCMNKK